MAENSQKIQEIISEALKLAPALMDGDLSQEDKLRLLRLVFQIAEFALSAYDERSAGQ